jgi:hypothetical protein
MDSFAAPLLWLSGNCQRAFLHFDTRHPLPVSEHVSGWKCMLEQTVNSQQWVLDLRRLPPLPQLVQQLLAEQWLHRIQQPSVRKVAIILPRDEYNMLVLECLLPFTPPHDWPEIQFFSDFASCWHWLNPVTRGGRMMARRCLKQRAVCRLHAFRSSRLKCR